MLYRPPVPRSLWGFWTIEHEGVFHIFYDEDINANYKMLSWQKNHDHVGHAVSRDLVHWETRPSLCVRGQAGEWNEMASGGMKTGCVICHEDRFYMFVGAQQTDDVQVLGLWTSDDSENWEQYPDNPVLKPGGPYYLEKPDGPRGSVSWRDPGIFYCRDDGFYHVCLSAMSKQNESGHVLGSVIGHVRSKDLIHWEHLPPFAMQGLLDRFYQNEEAEIFEIDGRYYLIFDGGTTGGMRVNTSYREDVRGSFYMMSTDLEGPYVLPEDDFLIGNDVGARCATTGRVIPYNGENLFIHFSIANRPVLGTLKYLRTRADGTLYLEYMSALEQLETLILCESTDNIPNSLSPDSGNWVKSDGQLRGNVKLGGSVYKVGEDISDFHFICDIRGASANRAGVVMRICRDGDVGIFPTGVAVVLDFEKQNIFVADANCYPKTGWYCKPVESCRLELNRSKAYKLRCFARDEHLEVYLDDRWIFTTILPAIGIESSYRNHYKWGAEVPASGDIELMIEHGEAIFCELHLAAIEPLEQLESY